jgi:hypothetical protein
LLLGFSFVCLFFAFFVFFLNCVKKENRIGTVHSPSQSWENP